MLAGKWLTANVRIKVIKYFNYGQMSLQMLTIHHPFNLFIMFSLH